MENHVVSFFLKGKWRWSPRLSHILTPKECPVLRYPWAFAQRLKIKQLNKTGFHQKYGHYSKSSVDHPVLPSGLSIACNETRQNSPPQDAGSVFPTLKGMPHTFYGLNSPSPPLTYCSY
ncbi:hypothetical protein AVEN_155558-1 [Araneus ventricosus]|uniref:Uncharacterized protein n=1 Tax=Araneus ventricosus TaxID=182803 RepID=A0A4Y1ZN97_ARAVE|nr:hypothetical protein AVEN_155558-1 [Araneus ventricosus]